MASKLIALGFSLSIGIGIGALGVAASSAGVPVLAALPAPPVRPAVPPSLPPNAIVTEKYVKITCPATAPAMFGTHGAWQQFAWGGTVYMVNFSPTTNEVYCHYFINNDPKQIVTMLIQKVPTALPAAVAKCVVDQPAKSVTCLK